MRTSRCRLAGLAGAPFVLPFNLNLARRGSVSWPVRPAATGERPEVQRVVLTWRQGWAALLLSIALLVASLGLTISFLS